MLAADPCTVLMTSTFGSDFSHFNERPPLPNSVYTCHDYTAYGFPNPPEQFTVRPFELDGGLIAGHRVSDRVPREGVCPQDAVHAGAERGSPARECLADLQGPIWVGEWGPVYQSAEDGIANWQDLNEARYEVAKCQLNIFAKHQASWAIWLWKGESCVIIV